MALDWGKPNLPANADHFSTSAAGRQMGSSVASGQMGDDHARQYTPGSVSLVESWGRSAARDTSSRQMGGFEYSPQQMG